jgi:hypothetical protein
LFLTCFYDLSFNDVYDLYMTGTNGGAGPSGGSNGGGNPFKYPALSGQYTSNKLASTTTDGKDWWDSS